MRKLYYLPGIISLTSFIFLLPYTYKKITPQKFNVLKLIVPSDKPDPSLSYTEVAIIESTRKKRKVNITLDRDLETNAKKLELIRYEARKLKYTFDTSTVIVIKFSNDLSYGEFIKVVDFCKEDSIRSYTPLQNNFIIFGEPPPVEPKIIRESSFIFFDDYVHYHKPIAKKSFVEKIIIAIKPYLRLEPFSMLIGWLILVITHLYYRRKRRLQTLH